MQQLLEGNKRYIEQKLAGKEINQEYRQVLKEEGQKPFAVIVGCSDSRVPPELIFDQAFGDLFVVRVAGNVIDAVAMASVEYAVEQLHSPLVVVLGHESCGAVKAAVDNCCDAIDNPNDSNMNKLLSLIQPSVQEVKKEATQDAPLYEAVTDKNVAIMVEKIKQNPQLSTLINQGKLSIVGAKYHLESGEVDFF
ncbi:carbonic anhydrase [Heliorestis acidaminivorans]|uniref:Carbonic anhydrase n=2 Tax=Heliorestis acidaminivorans TaxID=553427 RepID=A0A6I0FB15_9FIRM|nr:carbonic anhydrase [Heliorestis acidaminivorans]